MRKKYQNPPINELVIGIYFKDSIPQIHAEHIGLYWSLIKKEYPKSSQLPLIGNVDILVPNEMFPLQRFWFISDDEVYIIQIQRNAFILNWRKRDQKYPHYEELKARFDRNYQIFLGFLNEEFSIMNPTIERCELNYINMIEDKPYFKTFADVSNVVQQFTPPVLNEVRQLPSDFNVAYVYKMEPFLSLTLKLQSRRNRNTGNDTLYFELGCTGALSHGTKLEADKLFENAHDLIGDAFNSLTSTDIQREYWQPQEN